MAPWPMTPPSNAKGPASAATADPDHGPNIPTRKVMNTDTNTTEQAVPAMPDFEQAFSGLEVPIDTVVRRVRALNYLIGLSLDRKQDSIGFRRLSEGEMETLSSITWDISEAAEALNDSWTDTHNQRCYAEMADYTARKTGGRA